MTGVDTVPLSVDPLNLEILNIPFCQSEKKTLHTSISIP